MDTGAEVRHEEWGSFEALFHVRRWQQRDIESGFIDLPFIPDSDECGMTYSPIGEDETVTAALALMLYLVTPRPHLRDALPHEAPIRRPARDFDTLSMPINLTEVSHGARGVGGKPIRVADDGETEPGGKVGACQCRRHNETIRTLHMRES